NERGKQLGARLGLRRQSADRQELRRPLPLAGDHVDVPDADAGRGDGEAKALLALAQLLGARRCAAGKIAGKFVQGRASAREREVSEASSARLALKAGSSVAAADADQSAAAATGGPGGAWPA